jgi:hypothetical protein
MKNKIVIALVVIAAIVLYLKRKSIMTYYDILSTFLPGEESFSSKPYLDYKQYSWGYGTKVPSKYMGANGKPLAGITITRSQAFADMMVHINADKDYLSKLVKIDLTSSLYGGTSSRSAETRRTSKVATRPNALSSVSAPDFHRNALGTPGTVP